jgi:uncharacterized protein (TIGR02246 family)
VPADRLKQLTIKTLHMKNVLTCLSITFLFLTCSPQNDQNKDAIKKVVIAFQDDFNDGRFKHAPSYSTPDWVHINPGGGITRGHDSVLKEVRAVHQSFLKGVTMRIEDMDIRFVNPAVAIANVIHRINTYVSPDGVRHENEKQAKSYIIVKRQGKWFLVQDQNTIVQGSNTAASAK